MWRENWFIILVIIVVIGHVVAILRYAFYVLAREKVDPGLEETLKLKNKETDDKHLR